MDIRRPGPRRLSTAGLVGLALIAVLSPALGGCSNSGATLRTGTGPPPISVVPKGWKTYEYQGAAISVPPTWTVKHDLNCPNTSGPGALLLGLPAILDHCPEYHYPANVVALSTVGPATERGPSCQRLIRVNGLSVTPCGPSSDASADTVWLVPALGIEAMASGPRSMAVLRTLRTATPSG